MCTGISAIQSRRCPTGPEDNLWISHLTPWAALTQSFYQTVRPRRKKASPHGGDIPYTAQESCKASSSTRADHAVGRAEPAPPSHHCQQPQVGPADRGESNSHTGPVHCTTEQRCTHSRDGFALPLHSSIRWTWPDLTLQWQKPGINLRPYKLQDTQGELPCLLQCFLLGLSCISADPGLIWYRGTPQHLHCTTPALPSPLRSTSHAHIRHFPHVHMKNFLEQELVPATLQSPVLHFWSGFLQGLQGWKHCSLRNRHDSAWSNTIPLFLLTLQFHITGIFRLPVIILYIQCYAVHRHSQRQEGPFKAQMNGVFTWPKWDVSIQTCADRPRLALLVPKADWDSIQLKTKATEAH